MQATVSFYGLAHPAATGNQPRGGTLSHSCMHGDSVTASFGNSNGVVRSENRDPAPAMTDSVLTISYKLRKHVRRGSLPLSSANACFAEAALRPRHDLTGAMSTAGPMPRKLS